MPKRLTFIRMTALLMISSLLFDPVLAAGLIQEHSIDKSLQNRFQEEAFTARALEIVDSMSPHWSAWISRLVRISARSTADPYAQRLSDVLESLWKDSAHGLTANYERDHRPYEHLVIDSRNPEKIRYFLHLHFEQDGRVYARGHNSGDPTSLALVIEIVVKKNIFFRGDRAVFGELMLEDPYRERQFISVQGILSNADYRRTTASIRKTIRPTLPELATSIRQNAPRIPNLLKQEKDGRFSMEPRPSSKDRVQEFIVVTRSRIITPMPGTSLLRRHA